VSASDTGSTTATVTIEPGFAALSTTLHQPDFAPESPVNIDEARELGRLFTLSMFILAKVPDAIDRLQGTTDTQFQAGDLLIQAPSPEIRKKIADIVSVKSNTPQTIDALGRAMRSMLDLGTTTVPAVNGDFKIQYREFVTLAADANNGVDPDVVRPQDPAQAAVILNFLRALKRAILRITQNMSVYGTLGTQLLVDEWSKIIDDSLAVLDYVAKEKVVSSDADDHVAWAVLAALTDTPRSTVKAYVVNARDGGDLLQLAVTIYAMLQSGAAGANGLDNESDQFLQSLFFGQANEIEGKAVSVALKQPATLVAEHLTPLWP
jgi:hypothetical protein